MQKLNDPKIKGSERKRKLALCLIVQFQFVQTQSPLNFYALKHLYLYLKMYFLMIVKYFLIMILRKSFISRYMESMIIFKSKMSLFHIGMHSI